MSQVEYEKPSFQELVDEIAIIIEGKDSGAVLTALTVLVGNAGYFYEMEFEQFMDYVERNAYLVYRDQREAEFQSLLVH